MPTLTTRIRELRRERGMGQQELADIVGCRRETIGKLERGMYNPSLGLAMGIAKTFGKMVEEVFEFTDEEDKS